MNIAIIGFSVTLPDNVDTLDSLWKLLEDKVNTAREFPQDRVNIERFTSPHKNETHFASITPASNFLGKSIDQFDAKFFNVSASEASCKYHWLVSSTISNNSVIIQQWTPSIDYY
jgi:acyl transferase domain-containing protein